MSFHVPNEFRVRQGPYASTDDMTDCGAFLIPMPVPLGTTHPLRGPVLRVIAGAGLGWEHVSVSVDGIGRTPTWLEMEHVARLFWDDEDCIAQLHVPRSQWVNMHPFTLHLWRQVGAEWAQPPSWMVGFKAA